MKKLVLAISVLLFLLFPCHVSAAGTNMENAPLVNLNETFYGYLYDNPIDFYKFILPTSGKVTVTHIKHRREGHSNIYSFTEIVNRDGKNNPQTFWGCDYDSNRGYIYGVDYVYLNAGTYYLKNSEADGEYSYRLDFESTGETYAESDLQPLNYIDNAPEISIGDTVTGQVGGFDSQDFFKFTLTRSTNITISHVDYKEYYYLVKLFLLNSKGEYISFIGNDSDNPSTPYFTGEDSFSLSAGTYYLLVERGGGYCKGGKYTISLSEKPIDIKTPAIKRVKRSGKKASVKISKVSDASGYELAYSLNKNFPDAQTKYIRSTKTTIKLKHLKKKVYYAKVRAYKTIHGQKYYGKYSKVKKIKKK